MLLAFLPFIRSNQDERDRFELRDPFATGGPQPENSPLLGKPATPQNLPMNGKPTLKPVVPWHRRSLRSSRQKPHTDGGDGEPGGGAASGEGGGGTPGWGSSSTTPETHPALFCDAPSPCDGGEECPPDAAEEEQQRLVAAFFDEWQERVEGWWLAAVARDPRLGECLGALGLHIASRLESAFDVWKARLRGGPHGGHSAPTELAGQCSWLRQGEQSGALGMPELPGASHTPSPFPPLIPLHVPPLPH